MGLPNDKDLTYLSQSLIPANLQYCEDNAEYEVKVKEVNISPNPISRGEPATFTISANTSRGILGGKLVIEVTYLGWHIHSETHDLCAETTCPVQTGDFLVAHSQVLPGYTPYGAKLPSRNSKRIRADQIWRVIKENKDLDLPAHKDWRKLDEEVQAGPDYCFGNRFTYILLAYQRGERLILKMQWQSIKKEI